MRRTELDDRFWIQVDRNGPPGVDGTPCWLWMGSTTKEGYGRVKWNGREYVAHRLAYEVMRGPIPAGLELDHKCGREACVNYESHLEIVTHAENVRRREEARRTRQRARRETLAADVAWRESRVKQQADNREIRRYAEYGTTGEQALKVHSEAAARLAENILYSPHQPTPRQRAFLLDFGKEALYGGAAGGGKSDAILMAALQFISFPGYAALILRRTFPDLSKPGALLDRAATWFKGKGPKYHTHTHTWTFPEGGRIVFGYCESHADVLQYQSSEWQYIAIDEVAEWAEERTYTFLFSRLRRPSGVSDDDPLAKVPLRMRTGANPTGPGLKWVRDRFIVRGPHEGRTYYPARLEDNPHLDQKEYEHSLEQLDPYERLRLRHGDWFASPPGSMFRREWFYGNDEDIPCRIVPAADPSPEWDVIRYWRYPNPPKPGKEPDYLVGALVARHRSGTFLIADIRRILDTPEEGEELMRSVALGDGQTIPVYVEEKSGESGKSLIRHLRNKVFPSTHTVKKAPGTGDLVIRAEPVSSEASRGNLLLVDGPWVDAFIEEAELFPEAVVANQVHTITGACTFLDRRARGLVPDISVESATQANPWTNMRVVTV